MRFSAATTAERLLPAPLAGAQIVSNPATATTIVFAAVAGFPAPSSAGLVSTFVPAAQAQEAY
ncbi:hypothetical protein [Pseudaminobacter soli (ex Li et al. 2025)]|uniref:Uncharacterized protein n=1 Tax=Pseudaminobacter soli (ex Li et al. 2025) TaxID=1295366 RepID=A0A2P7RXI0_9HYPH|nr:hypothetical protein [Mesorhizobium soli]PSJ54930.1 hypothetical protein C7I85_27180 [Mesorhizobium soli]